jgi:uridine kinase
VIVPGSSYFSLHSRVVEALTRDGLLARLAELVTAPQLGRPVRVAIDGPDAAGKTTLADELAAALRGDGHTVGRAGVDDFKHPPGERYRRGRDSPVGYYLDSFDYAAVREAVLGASATLLFDGVFLLRPEVRDLWDVTIFVDVPFAETLRRALLRDVPLLGSPAEVEARYRARYIPGQELYFDSVRPAELADIVVCNEDPAASVLTTRRRGGRRSPP